MNTTADKILMTCVGAALFLFGASVSFWVYTWGVHTLALADHVRSTIQ